MYLLAFCWLFLVVFVVLLLVSPLVVWWFIFSVLLLYFCFLCICCRFVVTIGSYILTYNNNVCVHIYIHINSQACLLSHFSRVGLCSPVNCSPPGSSVRRILHAKTLEWVAMPSSRGSSWPRDQTRISPWYLRLQLQFQKFSDHLARSLGLVNGFPSW